MSKYKVGDEFIVRFPSRDGKIGMIFNQLTPAGIPREG